MNNMGIYIQDDKKHTVRHYCTSRKIEKAIETLLLSDDELVSSETHVGYVVTLIDEIFGTHIDKRIYPKKNEDE